MQREKIKIDLSKAIDLDFEDSEEHWNTYTLSDGTTLKVKIVLRGVKRLEQYEPDGAPIYVINSVNVVRAVNIPPKLRHIPGPKGGMTIVR